MLIIVNLTAML